jgi:hypothetical protein
MISRDHRRKAGAGRVIQIDALLDRDAEVNLLGIARRGCGASALAKRACLAVHPVGRPEETGEKPHGERRRVEFPSGAPLFQRRENGRHFLTAQSVQMNGEQTRHLIRHPWL